MTNTENRNKENTVTLEFIDRLDITTVNDHKKAIEAALLENKNIEIDLSGISKFDTPGFQLLVFADHELRKLGRQFKICKPSAEVMRLLNLYDDTFLLLELNHEK